MPWIDFAAYSLWVNIAVFVISAAIVWLVGSRLSVYAVVIADRSGLGEVFVGLLVLAVATSLPEIGRTITASLLGDAALAVDSLLGGIALQTALLAIADFVVARRVLTYFAPDPGLILEGTVVVLLLGLALAGIAAGEVVQFFGIGLWTTTLAVVYFLSLYVLKSYQTQGKWLPVDVPVELKEQTGVHGRGRALGGEQSLSRLALLFGLSCLVLLISGVLLAEVGGALAVQTGLGGGFVGATLLAFASSLPELSTTVAAVRLGAYSMAISNIFGTNAFLVALLFLADLFYRPGPILHAVDRSAVFIASVGIVTTAVYLVGMIERRNRLVLGMGIDSLVVLAVYALSLLILFLIR